MGQKQISLVSVLFLINVHFATGLDLKDHSNGSPKLFTNELSSFVKGLILPLRKGYLFIEPEVQLGTCFFFAFDARIPDVGLRRHYSIQAKDFPHLKAMHILWSGLRAIFKRIQEFKTIFCILDYLWTRLIVWLDAT